MRDTEQIYHEALTRLNAREYKFVAEYLITGNATQAAKKSGYRERTAGEIGWENLKKPDVFAAIQTGLTLIAHRCEVDAEKVVRELAAIAFASAHHYETAADGTLVVT